MSKTLNRYRMSYREKNKERETFKGGLCKLWLGGLSHLRFAKVIKVHKPLADMSKHKPFRSNLC